MKERHLQRFIEVMPNLNEIMQDDITIVVFDLRNEIFAAYAPGQLKMPSKVGELISQKKL